MDKHILKELRRILGPDSLLTSWGRLHLLQLRRDPPELSAGKPKVIVLLLRIPRPTEAELRFAGQTVQPGSFVRHGRRTA